ncbi:MAG: hypothetical protein JWN78_2455 [Bacteroidota bacterium]|nr:hypothetical protein [Bacteroidota bacterium]
MEKDNQLLNYIENRFKWLQVNGKHIIYVDLSGANENEYVACIQYIRAVTYQSPHNDIRGIFNLTNIKFTPKMIHYSMQMAKYGSKKTIKKAGIGSGPFVMAFYRITRLQSPNTKLCKTYEEALEYVSS